MEARNLTWGESLKISGYNLKFKALSYLEESSPTDLLPDFEELFLFGQKFACFPDNHKVVNELIFKKFSTTPWITYRSGFKQVISKKGQSFVTDAGWGCMIRAGQMYFAQALKKHLKLTQKEELYQIMKLFDDSDQNAMFSIQNIIKLAREEYELEPGVWYNPSQIIFILNDLYTRHAENPYRKTLTNVIMNNSSLIFDQIVEKMTNKQKRCDCKKQYAVCYKCDKFDVSVSLVVMSRIGLDEPEPKYLKVLSQIMQIPSFQGFIGGKPGKALYILGIHNRRFIYLDPHMPQAAVSKSNFQKQKQTYFCKTFRSCKRKQIDPSMGISFYLRNLQEVDELYRLLTNIKKNNSEDFFIYMTLQTPDFMRPGYDLKQMFQIYSDEEKQDGPKEKKEESNQKKQKPEKQQQKNEK